MEKKNSFCFSSLLFKVVFHAIPLICALRHNIRGIHFKSNLSALSLSRRRQKQQASNEIYDNHYLRLPVIVALFTHDTL